MTFLHCFSEQIDSAPVVKSQHTNLLTWGVVIIHTAVVPESCCGHDCSHKTPDYLPSQLWMRCSYELLIARSQLVESLMLTRVGITFLPWDCRKKIGPFNSGFLVLGLIFNIKEVMGVLDTCHCPHIQNSDWCMTDTCGFCWLNGHLHFKNMIRTFCI